MLKQLSIYAENEKGTLEKITGALVDASINIWGSVVSDNAEYGVIRMIVSDPELAVLKIKEGGYICRLTNVIGVEVADEVGNLNKLLRNLQEMNINIDYIYLSFNRESSLPVMIFHTEDVMEVEEGLRMRGFSVL